jgi:hypothetical protein
MLELEITEPESETVDSEETIQIQAIAYVY